jgi:hypothetical protein
VPLIIGYYVSGETRGEELSDLCERPIETVKNQDV